MNVTEIGAKGETEARAGNSTWVQITFTLDPEQYRSLWQRAEHERRTIPACVRESVIDFLKTTSQEMKTGVAS